MHNKTKEFLGQTEQCDTNDVSANVVVTNQEILDVLGEDVVQTAMTADIEEGLAVLAELKSKPMNREGRRFMKRRNNLIGLLLAFTMIGGVLPIISSAHINTYEPEDVPEHVDLPESQPLVEFVGSPIIDELVVEETPLENEPVFGFTDNDIYLLSQLLAGNEGVHGDGEYDFEWQLLHQEPNDDQISLVLEVVMNRIDDPRWGDTIESVVLQPHQFSVFPKNNRSKPSPLVVDYISGWCESYDTGELVKTIPEDHVYFTGDGTNNHSRSVWM